MITTTQCWPVLKYTSIKELLCFSALDKLGFGDYRSDAEAVLSECKAVAAKRRRQSTRLENLGIPEEELLRQQQELFAKVGLVILIIECFVLTVLHLKNASVQFLFIL